MEYASPVYRRYYEEYEALGLTIDSPWNIGLLHLSVIIAWMDKPENKKRSADAMEQVRRSG